MEKSYQACRCLRSENFKGWTLDMDLVNGSILLVSEGPGMPPLAIAAYKKILTRLAMKAGKLCHRLYLKNSLRMVLLDLSDSDIRAGPVGKKINGSQ